MPQFFFFVIDLCQHPHLFNGFKLFAEYSNRRLEQLDALIVGW